MKRLLLSLLIGLLTLLARAAPAGPAMTLRVDASNTGQWIVNVHASIPAAPGRLRLLYPRFLPGYHGPEGDVQQIAGLCFFAAGKRLAWQRAADDLNAFDVDVPAGATTVSVNFQWLGVGKAATPPLQARDMLSVQWPLLLLYPAGRPLTAVPVNASVKLPAGWGWGSALRARDGAPAQAAQTAQGEGWVEFQTESLETLLDSPVYAGAHYRRIELDPPGTPHPVALHLFGSDADKIKPSDEQIAAHRRLFQQAEALFGSRPWRHYDLLLANGSDFPFIALEHHESSENAHDGRYFDDWTTAVRRRDVLAHEVTHAWNGKFRRPAGLIRADLNSGTSNELLWVYEGLTEYFGQLLAVRSGLVTPAQLQRQWSRGAAYFAQQAGSRWRPLQDTTFDPAFGKPPPERWPDWTRGYDYYVESALRIWLDADTLIRERSGGRRSLDDFARLFFATPSGLPAPKPYELDDLLAALNAVLPHDWRGFLQARMAQTSPGPTQGLERAGWRIAFADERSSMDLAALSPKKPLYSMDYSVGLAVLPDGEIASVGWDSPAFHAGLAPGDKLLAVQRRGFTPERAEAALKANRDGSQPLELLVQRGDDFLLVTLDVRTGPRHPAPARIEGRPDLLADIFKPR
ncbi:MAG TPA: peptidase M61 [Roseateles sp.]